VRRLARGALSAYVDDRQQSCQRTPTLGTTIKSKEPTDADGEHAGPRVSCGGSGWGSLTQATDGDQAAEDALRRLNEELERRLLGVLGAERLVVLAGLGTSLGISGAPSMAGLWDAASGVEGFANAVALVPEAEATKDIEMVLSRCQFAIGLGQDDGLVAFMAAAEDLIVQRCRFVDEATDLQTHQLFLRKVARRSTRLPRTQLFTTNYDLAFERAADGSGFRLIDGFTLAEPRRFEGGSFDLDFVRRRIGERPTLEPNVAQFMKLHGSVDWDSSTGQIERRSEPVVPVLIYPAQTKFQLSYELPYLECMARLQMALREPDVGVVVVGFGFRDEHLAGPIASAVRSNVGLRLIVVAPSVETNDNPHIAFIRDLIERGDRRLTLFAGTFSEFVSVLPDVAPPDEREEHERRIDAAADVLEA
jgi:hypothetical protein